MADGEDNCEANFMCTRDIHVNSREFHVRMTCILGVLGAIVQPGLPKQELPPSAAEFPTSLSFASRSRCRTHSLYSNCQYTLVDALI